MKQRLEETKVKLKSICKDAHFADELISSLLSIKGQLEHEPTIEHILASSVVDDFQDKGMYIARLDDGRLLYKLYGGYTIICDARMKSLYDTINGILDIATGVDEVDPEIKEDVDLALSVIGYVLSAPIYAFTDESLATKIATDVIEYLANVQLESESQELSPDDDLKNYEMVEMTNYVDSKLKEVVENGADESNEAEY